MKMRDKYPRLFTMMSVGLLLMVIGLFFMLMSCVGSFNEMEWTKTNTPLFISVVLFLLGAMLFFTARQMFKTRKAKNEQDGFLECFGSKAEAAAIAAAA